MILFLYTVLVVTAGIAVYGAKEIVRIPFLGIPYTPKNFGWSYDTVAFSSFDGLRLTGWFVRPQTPTDKTILILHGKGSNAGDMLLNTRCLADEGRWNLFYFNFRGHADSQGRFTSLGPLEQKDMDSALAFLKAAYPAQSRHIAVMGHSLGSAVAIMSAAEHPEIEAVLAESPFADIARTIRRFAWLLYHIPPYPFLDFSIALVSLFLRQNLWAFSPSRAIAKISPRPVLLIQAECDRRTPVEDTQDLYEKAKDPKELWVVKGADHGRPWEVEKAQYEKRVVEFFRRHFK